MGWDNNVWGEIWNWADDPSGPVPSPGENLIVLRCEIHQNGTPVKGAVVTAKLQEDYSAIDDNFRVASSLKTEAITDDDGIADLILYKQKAFSQGSGRYNIQARHNSRIIWSHSIAMPNDKDVVYLPELSATAT